MVLYICDFEFKPYSTNGGFLSNVEINAERLTHVCGMQFSGPNGTEWPGKHALARVSVGFINALAESYAGQAVDKRVRVKVRK